MSLNAKVDLSPETVARIRKPALLAAYDALAEAVAPQCVGLTPEERPTLMLAAAALVVQAVLDAAELDESDFEAVCEAVSDGQFEVPDESFTDAELARLEEIEDTLGLEI